MKVLQGNILVLVKTHSENDLVQNRDVRKGKVVVSGSNQIHVDNEVLFGDKFEEIQIEKSQNFRYYLMKEDNVKIIYDSPTPDPTSVLPFLKRGA